MACKYIYKGIVYNSKEEFINQVINPQFLSNKKVRRVMELQSDLFQKGRDKQSLAGYKSDLSSEEEQSYNRYLLETGQITQEEFDNPKIIGKEKENQFLQLLNKDNNWVTFFIKSIIQDSAKKGYEKVLFPKGETAAKIEGHETLANRLLWIDNEIQKLKSGITSEGSAYSSAPEGVDVGEVSIPQEEANKRIASLEKEKAELKSQGIEKLRPIEAFYEIKVGNILEKQFGKALITENDKVIWGHPGIGKTYLFKGGRKDIIDFDSEYKIRINKEFNLPVDENDGLGARQIFRKEHKEIYDNKLRELFIQAKQDAIDSNRKLLVSDLLVLREFSNDIDKVINMPSSVFIERSKQRGEFDIENKLKWKQSIDETLKTIDKSKVITTDKYIGEVLNEGVKTITDEYGNQWREITINQARDLDNILLQKNEANRIIGQANIKAMTVLVDAVNKKEDTIPHEYAHHYIAWFRNTPIVQEAIKRFGSEEALVQAIGEQVVKQKGEAYNWWKKFTNWILNLLSDKQLLQVLTDSFLNRQDLHDFTYNQPNTQQKQQAIEIYSKYLDTIFPDSKVKDIVYHGSKEKFDKFDKIQTQKNISKKIFNEYVNGFYFSEKGEYGKEYSVLLNSKMIRNFTELFKEVNTDVDYALKKELNQITKDIENNKFDTAIIERPLNIRLKPTGIYVINIKKENTYSVHFSNDGMATMANEVAKNVKEEDLVFYKKLNNENKEYNNSLSKTYNWYVVFKPEQIHILGSKQDIEGFKKFTKRQSNDINNQENNNIEQSQINENNTESFTKESLNKKIDELLKSGEIYYTDDDSKPCAANGLRNTVKGTDWKIATEFKGKSHAQGGIDITLNENGYHFRRGGKDIKAANGLIIENK